MLRYLRYALGTGTRFEAACQRGRFILALRRCREQQECVLSRLLQLHAGSDFSRRHGLESVRTIREFQRAIPPADFERARPYVERLKQGEWRALLGEGQSPLMFAMSSGTTAEPKYIPITRQYLADYRRGWKAWGIDIYRRYFAMNFLHIVQLASDFDRFRTPAGSPCGNITGFVQHIQNPIVRTMYSVPNAVLKITDPASRYYAALRFAIADERVGMMITANPGTLLHLDSLAGEHADSLLTDIAEGTLSSRFDIPAPVRVRLTRRLPRRPDRARRLAQIASDAGRLTLAGSWPRLQLLGVWTGGSAAAYLPSLRQRFPGVTIRDHGLSASEGRMTITLQDETPAAPLDITSHFFEFIPESEIDSSNPDVLLAHELQPGECYSVLLTTSCGLYRYDIRDVVRCTGFVGTTPLVEFLHKGAHIANITGEKLTESQVVEAVLGASKAFGLSLSGFTLTPVWGEPPRYHLLIEQGDLPANGAKPLADEVDRRLMAINCEYDDKRRTARLRPIVVEELPSGTWKRMIRMRQAGPSGSLEQYKHPCLAPSLEFRDRLLAEHPQARAA